MNKLFNLMIVAAFCMTAVVACGDKDNDTGADTAEVVEPTDTADTGSDQGEDTGSAEDTGASEDAATTSDASAVDVTVDASEAQEDSTEEETD